MTTLHARFVWTNRGLRKFIEEVEAACVERSCRLCDVLIQRGLLGVRWLIIAEVTDQPRPVTGIAVKHNPPHTPPPQDGPRRQYNGV